MGMIGSIIFSDNKVAGAARIESVQITRKPANQGGGAYVHIQVNLFQTAAQMASDQGLIWQHPVTNVVPLEAMDCTKLFESIERWLVENDPMFADCEYSDGSAPAETLTAVKASRLEALNWAYSAKVGMLAEGYPKVEQASWPQQVEEAYALQNGAGAALTPWLTACAAARGVTREVLADLILAKNTPYRTVHGHYTGVRQLAEKAIEDAATVEDVRSVTWDFSIPGSAPVEPSAQNGGTAPGSV